MNDDLVDRLRRMGDRASHRPNIYHTAADRIEALTARAEAAEARAKAAEASEKRFYDKWMSLARAALKGEQK